MSSAAAGGSAATTPLHDLDPRVRAEHDARVRTVADAVRDLARTRGPAYVDKGGVHHVVPLPDGDGRFAGRRIDVSALRHVLAIDPATRECVVEPGVTFRALVEATLPHGLVPAVVPELEGITVGGAVAGCAVESASFRHGGFHDGCVAYEAVSGTGEVIACSRDREPFVFEMLHGSYGTLGILTAIRMRLVPARRSVRVSYERHGDAASFQTALRARIEDADVDFVDGIVHAPDHWTLCVGRFVDEPPRTGLVRRVEVYYRTTRTRRDDVLATADYFFRYDTEAHWLSRTVPPLEWMPVRLLLGSFFLGSTNMIRWSARLAPLFSRLKRRPDVVCDYFIPAARVDEFYGWCLRELRYFPLWIVPYRVATPYPWLAESRSATRTADLWIDVAIYGLPNGDPAIDRSAQLEEKTWELGGIKTLISRNHYDRERFWSIYHESNYRQAKARLDPDGVFRDLYEKLHRVG